MAPSYRLLFQQLKEISDNQTPINEEAEAYIEIQNAKIVPKVENNENAIPEAKEKEDTTDLKPEFKVQQVEDVENLEQNHSRNPNLINL